MIRKHKEKSDSWKVSVTQYFGLNLKHVKSGLEMWLHNYQNDMVPKFRKEEKTGNTLFILEESQEQWFSIADMVRGKDYLYGCKKILSDRQIKADSEGKAGLESKEKDNICLVLSLNEILWQFCCYIHAYILLFYRYFWIVLI